VQNFANFRVRFYQAQQGQILLHGTDIENVSMNDYRKSISLVAQEASLFEGSMRQNILLGVDESATSDETLHQACRDAEIHDFISSLPEGYDTAVGIKGIALSGGQKQRIAIARALIRNPRVLLLDEATSNLDSETEKAVQEVLEKNGKGRTMVVVAHRLATVQNADVIFVMSEGSVVETGNHASLLRARGIYYQMVRLPCADLMMCC
jgi:ATP-binding cassette subfamily B (MDR/TAP) protein 1